MSEERNEMLEQETVVTEAETTPVEEVREEACRKKRPQEETAQAQERQETMEDYARELEASFKRVKEGDVLTGVVAGVTEDQVLVDLKYYAGGSNQQGKYQWRSGLPASAGNSSRR